VRSLTPAEAKVIRSMLASRPGSEAERITSSGIPRRTYQEIRRRAFAEGWLEPRYVPNGPYFGLPFVTFRLVHPFLERMSEDRADWTANPSTVLLWTTPEVLFDVEFSSKPPNSQAGSFHKSFALTVDARGPTVPAYFDFEGCWATWTRQEGTLAYPHPLPGAERVFGVRRAPGTPELHAARELLAMASRSGHGSRAASSESLPRSLRRVIRTGAVQYRVFPNLAQMPPFEDRTVQKLALVHGQLRASQRPEDLFRAVVREAGVFPFLFVADRREVLLGALAVDNEAEERRPVLETLSQFLVQIEAARLDVSSLFVPIPHHYERLFEKVAVTLHTPA
jgi:hypothetical protein